MFSVLRFENIDSSFLLNFSRKKQNRFRSVLFRSVGRRRARRRLMFIFSRFRTTPTVGSLCRFFCGLFFFAFCVGKTAVAAGRGWPVGRLVSGQAERALLRCRKKTKENKTINSFTINEFQMANCMVRRPVFFFSDRFIRLLADKQVSMKTSVRPHWWHRRSSNRRWALVFFSILTISGS